MLYYININFSKYFPLILKRISILRSYQIKRHELHTLNILHSSSILLFFYLADIFFGLSSIAHIMAACRRFKRLEISLRVLN